MAPCFHLLVEKSMFNLSIEFYTHVSNSLFDLKLEFVTTISDLMHPKLNF